MARQISKRPFTDVQLAGFMPCNLLVIHACPKYHREFPMPY